MSLQDYRNNRIIHLTPELTKNLDKILNFIGRAILIKTPLLWLTLKLNDDPSSQSVIYL